MEIYYSGTEATECQIEDLTSNTDMILPIILIKEFQLQSYIMEYLMYKEIWKPVNVEELNATMEPRNVTENMKSAFQKMTASSLVT